MGARIQGHVKVSEAARRLGQHPGTIRYWIRTGVMRGRRLGPKLYWIPVSEVERMLETVRQVGEIQSKGVE